MADQVHIPQEASGPASEPASARTGPQFGLTAAMALIVGSIIGVGVFFLAAGALLLGIPVYLSQRRHMTPPEPVPPFR